jgi:hypothetical protein
MGLVDKLPEHLKSRTTAEAITAPTAILLAGAGTAVAIVGGLPLLAAAAVGAAAYGIRVAFGLPRKAKSERIELASLSEPWRHFVREAIDAQRRYEKAIKVADAGPLRDRLVEIGERINAGVHECYRIARRGAALEGGLASMDADQARQQLVFAVQALPAEVEGELGRAVADGALDKDVIDAARAAGADESHVRTIEALYAQVASAERLQTVAQDARDRLSLLDARLDEAVARAVEISLVADDVGELGGLGGDVENLVGEMEALRAGLEEAVQAGRGGTTGTGASGTGAAGTGAAGAT